MGKKLVEELGTMHSQDTLVRWMAHYLAEKLIEAEAANGVEREAKQAECAKLILDFWEHRARFPRGNRPFRQLDPILKTLESLSADSALFRYEGAGFGMLDETDGSTEADQWLVAAKNLDTTARILIRYCLASSAKGTLENLKEWAELADAATAEPGIESAVVSILASESNLLDAEIPTDHERKALEDRLRQLEVFQKISAKVMVHLHQRLQDC